MSNAEAIRTLQHASEYIFTSHIARGPKKRIRGTRELWQTMATLHECRNSVVEELQSAVESAKYRRINVKPMLVCSLNA